MHILLTWAHTLSVGNNSVSKSGSYWQQFTIGEGEAYEILEAGLWYSKIKRLVNFFPTKYYKSGRNSVLWKLTKIIQQNLCIVLKKEKKADIFYNNSEGLWYFLLKLLPSLISAKSAWWCYQCRAMHKTSSFVSGGDVLIWIRTQPVLSSNKNHDKWHTNWEANGFKWQWIGKTRGSVSLRLQSWLEQEVE